MIENKISYKDGIKRSFWLLSGWKTKLKFFILYYILNYITSFILELLFFGVLAGTLILALFIYSFLKGAMFWFVVIELCIIVLSFYLVFMIEISTTMSGTFYGQSYVNLAHPELMPSQKPRYVPFVGSPLPDGSVIIL